MVIEFLKNQAMLSMAVYVIGALILLSLGMTWMVIHLSGKRLLYAYTNMVTGIGMPIVLGLMLYLALIANSVMYDNAEAQHAVAKEAHSLHVAFSILDKNRYPLWHQAIVAYTDQVINAEWPEMQRGALSYRAFNALNDMLLLSNELPNISPELRKRMHESVTAIGNARQQRLFAAVDNVPTEIWANLWLAVLVVIFFAAASHAHEPSSAYVMAILYGLILGSLIVAIFAIDNPYSGPSAVSAQPILSIVASQ